MITALLRLFAPIKTAILGLVPPTGDDPAKVRQWRWSVAWSQYLTWLSIVIGALVVFGTIDSPYKLAIAADTARQIETVSAEAKAAAAAVQQAVSDLNTEVTRFTLESRHSTQVLLESQLWATWMEMCWRQPGERIAYQQRLMALQQQYVALKGSGYGLPSCEEF